jgi:hypothetical protein
MVFLVDPDLLLLDRLFFLRELLLSLHRAGKRMGIWGVPECVLIDILTPALFSELRAGFLEETGPGRCRFDPGIFARTALRLECRPCIARERCGGMGRKPENLLPREYRSAHDFRRRGRERLFRSEDPELRERYRRFADYVDRSDLRYADRYLYFVKTLDYGSPYVQTDRFVYHCDYLPRRDYPEEATFLASQTLRSDRIEDLRLLGSSGAVARFAYSRGRGKRGERESFYFAPPDPSDHTLLSHFGVPRSYGERERLIGVGIDYYDGRLESYKIYTELRGEELWRRFPAYLERIGIDPLELRQRRHYHVLRLDPGGSVRSERIDWIYDPRDRARYRSYLGRFPFGELTGGAIHIMGLAFDFSDGHLQKVTLYYRNVYR